MSFQEFPQGDGWLTARRWSADPVTWNSVPFYVSICMRFSTVNPEKLHLHILALQDSFDFLDEASICAVCACNVVFVWSLNFIWTTRSFHLSARTFWCVEPAANPWNYGRASTRHRIQFLLSGYHWTSHWYVLPLKFSKKYQFLGSRVDTLRYTLPLSGVMLNVRYGQHQLLQ